jgi:hypothetical protein
MIGKCEICGVSVNSPADRCPLCGKTGLLPLGDTPDAEVDLGYPSYARPLPSRSAFAARLGAFSLICAGVVCSAVNLFTLASNPFPWAAIVIASGLFLWISLRLVLGATGRMGYRVWLEVLSLSLLLALIDGITGFSRWSTTYVIPFLILSGNLTVTLTAIFHRSRWVEYSGFLFAGLLISLLPVLGFPLGLSLKLWPPVVSALFSALALVGFAVFSLGRFRIEAKKRLHL